jgi:hypothetical protein
MECDSPEKEAVAHAGECAPPKCRTGALALFGPPGATDLAAPCIPDAIVAPATLHPGLAVSILDGKPILREHEGG